MLLLLRDSVLIQIKSNNEAFAMLADFGNVQFIENAINEDKLIEDLYYFGLVSCYKLDRANLVF